jgi:hypothetical protein
MPEVDLNQTQLLKVEQLWRTLEGQAAIKDQI